MSTEIPYKQSFFRRFDLYSAGNTINTSENDILDAIEAYKSFLDFYKLIIMVNWYDNNALCNSLIDHLYILKSFISKDSIGNEQKFVFRTLITLSYVKKCPNQIRELIFEVINDFILILDHFSDSYVFEKGYISCINEIGRTICPVTIKALEIILNIIKKRPFMIEEIIRMLPSHKLFRIILSPVSLTNESQTSQFYGIFGELVTSYCNYMSEYDDCVNLINCILFLIERGDFIVMEGVFDSLSQLLTNNLVTIDDLIDIGIFNHLCSDYSKIKGFFNFLNVMIQKEWSGNEDIVDFLVYSICQQMMITESFKILCILSEANNESIISYLFYHNLFETCIGLIVKREYCNISFNSFESSYYGGLLLSNLIVKSLAFPDWIGNDISLALLIRLSSIEDDIKATQNSLSAIQKIVETNPNAINTIHYLLQNIIGSSSILNII